MWFILLKKRLFFIFLISISISISISIFISNFAMAASGTNHAAEFIGSFSNIRYTDEHAYGLEVQLWKDKKGIFGFFLSSNGLQGDTPTGKLDNVVYNATSGHLQFSAKLTTGMLSSPTVNNQPSRDLFAFEGHLKKSLLQGTLSIREMHAPKVVEKKSITLKKTKEPGDYIQSRPDYEAFFQAIKPTRGPRW